MSDGIRFALINYIIVIFVQDNLSNNIGNLTKIKSYSPVNFEIVNFKLCVR